jgi:hypothetical protein
MDITTYLFESIRVIFCFFLLLFVPGLALSLVIFPRLADLSTIDRMVYSIVLSISSGIASVVFIDIVPGLDLTLDTFILITSVFSLALLLLWAAERYYLTSRLKKREPEIPKDNRDPGKYHTRRINAAKDRFRADTRTVVVYHESWKTGSHHIGHAFLMDAGKEIDIEQVAENKLNPGDRYITDPPYPKTRYFEVIIREYNDNGLSQVDDLQIYPVFVTKDLIRSQNGPALPPGALQITKRICQKTSTTLIEWIYSHDFHIFAILHAEDTLSQMVDLILGKLDEIVSSLEGDIESAAFQKDPRISKNASDTGSDNSRPGPSLPGKIPRHFAYQPGGRSGSLQEPPLNPPGNQPMDIINDVHTIAGPEEVPPRPGVHTPAQVRDIRKHPENKLVVDSIRKLQKDILRDLDMFNMTTESFKGSKKNIENIRIPKKADINKKLADAEGEMRDLDWLYE